MALSSFRTPGVAVLIGAASGIGKATALAYARNGTRGLVLADFDEPGVRRTAEQAKQEATNDEFSVIALHADVRDYSSVENVFEHAVKKFGRIDYSVNTAGAAEQIYKFQANIADNNLDLYDDVMATNAKGVLHHTKAAVRVMLKQELLVIQGVDRVRNVGRGSIVNVCSIAGLQAVPGAVEYVASKFAAVGITRTAAVEYGPSQIRINAMCPGAIETPLLERAMAPSFDLRASYTKAASLNRVGDVEEVADAILFLTSNAGSFVHGSSMTVDGGATNKGPV